MAKIILEFNWNRSSKTKKKVNNHVLEDFKEDEEEKIKEITENIVKQIPTLIDKKIDLFSSEVSEAMDLNVE